MTAPERTGGYTMHLCLDIRGALRRSKREMRGWFRHDDGRVMTPDEAREALLDELAKGRRVLPIGECEGFDYQTGCPGHPTSRAEGAAPGDDVDKGASPPSRSTPDKAGTL